MWRIVAPGDSGAARAAQDVAQALGLPGAQAADTGAALPPGELPDAGATLVLTNGRLAGSALETVEAALGAGRPCRVVDLRTAPPAAEVRDWIALYVTGTLHVAGPHEPEQPGIYGASAPWLHELLAPLAADGDALSAAAAGPD